MKSDIPYKNLSSNQNISNTLIFSIMIILGIGFFSIVDTIDINAQQQTNSIPLRSNDTTADSRTFKVTFDSLVVNDDHDPFFSGEWVMNAYVNNRIINLFPGSINIDSGDVVNLTGINSATLTVPNNNTGFIRISTIGWENDVGYEPIPVFFTLLDTRVPFYLYSGLVQQATVPFTLGPNDPNGFVAVQYDENDNFGIGSHSICSERNVAATDPTGPFEGDCDYRINFTIEEVSL